jgi:hypothetical protein
MLRERAARTGAHPGWARATAITCDANKKALGPLARAPCVIWTIPCRYSHLFLNEYSFRVE